MMFIILAEWLLFEELHVFFWLCLSNIFNQSHTRSEITASQQQKKKWHRVKSSLSCSVSIVVSKVIKLSSLLFIRTITIKWNKEPDESLFFLTN